MQTVLKWIGIALGLLVVGIVVLVLVFDWNWIKGFVEREASQALGRTIVITLPQSGRLDDGEQPQGLPDARAPRLFAVTVCIPAVDITLRLVGFSRRLCSASHPTVETVYSLAQKVAPWPWRWRPPSCRATVIADVPWREPTTAATTSDPGLPDFHNTKSAGQALRVSLVKPGAYLSASYS